MEEPTAEFIRLTSEMVDRIYERYHRDRFNVPEADVEGIKALCVEYLVEHRYRWGESKTPSNKKGIYSYFFMNARSFIIRQLY
jgi:hypothetical protein